jgi:hypothetical protein
LKFLARSPTFLEQRARGCQSFFARHRNVDHHESAGLKVQQ